MTSSTSMRFNPLIDDSVETTEGSLLVNCSSQCLHEIVEDLIDITPDKSKYIYYCKKCYMCFDTLCGKNPRK